jgi:cytochrome c553
LQLTLFQKASRGGTPYAHIMAMVARRLTPQQIHDVTHYYASLTANTETAARVRSARDSSAMREP